MNSRKTSRKVSGGEIHTCILWLDYLPPSRNTLESGRLRAKIQRKQAARDAWLSAWSASDGKSSITTISLAESNTSRTPLPPALELTTATNRGSPSSILNTSPLENLERS